ncbi:hypothetical protein SCG7109_AW_00080 [Chlamydiales bacterium SCGC AG-110-M15]|nr:hypothetical protein SCG7109_AW_00080 [Chlamydiales bacterium SCGC AG-110-M15]
MIKLRVRIGKEEIERSFPSAPVSIGMSENSEVEVVPPDQLIYPEQIRIIQKEDKTFSATRIADDPELFYNYDEFQETDIQVGDSFSLGQVEVTIDELSAGDSDIDMSENELDDLLSQIDEEGEEGSSSDEQNADAQTEDAEGDEGVDELLASLGEEAGEETPEAEALEEEASADELAEASDEGDVADLLEGLVPEDEAAPEEEAAQTEETIEEEAPEEVAVPDELGETAEEGDVADLLEELVPQEEAETKEEAIQEEVELPKAEEAEAVAEAGPESEEDIGDAIDSLFSEGADDGEDEFDLDSILHEAEEKEQEDKNKFDEQIGADGALVFDDDDSELSEIRRAAGLEEEEEEEEAPEETAQEESEEKSEESSEEEQAPEALEEEADSEELEEELAPSEEVAESEEALETLPEEAAEAPVEEAEEQLPQDLEEEPQEVSQEEVIEDDSSEQAESEGEKEAPEETKAAASVKADQGRLIYDEEDDISDREAALLGGIHQKKHLIALGGIAVVLIVAIISAFSGINFYIDSTNQNEETLASQSLADLAMGLTKARLYGENIGNGDVRSGEFKGTHLSAVLAPHYATQSPLINTAYLESVDYELKVFFTESQDRFVALAIPSPGLLQSWFPRKALIVESELMDIRQTSNIDGWVKLFEGVSSLEDVSKLEVTSLAEEAEAIYLADLDAEERSNGFAPPRTLEDWRPGAEFSVFNAPRYYPFTDSIIQLAARLANEGGTEKDLDNLRTEVRRLAPLGEIIFYSSGGIKQAQDSYRAVSVHAPGTALIWGYINFAEGNKEIDEARLLSEDEFPASTEVAAITYTRKPTRGFDRIIEEIGQETQIEEDVFAATQPEPLIPMDIASTQDDLAKPIERDTDPKLKRLLELLAEREEVLTKASDNIQTLLARQTRDSITGFDQKYSELFTRYQELDANYQKKIDQELAELYFEFDAGNSNEGQAAYLAMIEKAGMSQFLDDELMDEVASPETQDKEAEQTRIVRFFERINEEKSLTQLGRLVNELASKLQVSGVHDPVQLVAWQNQLRSLVLEKLSLLLLSSNSLDAGVVLEDSDRKTLDGLLHDANISGEDERNFYLDEFDQLMEDYRDSPDSRELQGLQEINDKMAKFSAIDPLLTEEQHLELEMKHERATLDIEDKKKDLSILKSKLARVPLSPTSAMTVEEEKQELGRIGQQILITASLQTPGRKRDGLLYEAITLLEEGAADNRALWAEILEARRLLSQTPETQALEAIHSGIGFLTADHSLPGMVKDELANYYESKRNLAQIRDLHQFQAQYRQFKIAEKKRLKDILEAIATIQRESEKLDASVKEYERRLHTFAEDYERAKLQGFFVTNLDYQSQMANRLLRKIWHAEEFSSEVSKLSNHILKSARSHKEIAQNELKSLQVDARSLDVNEVQDSFQEIHHIVYPNLAMANLPQKAKKLFDIAIAPLP